MFFYLSLSCLIYFHQCGFFNVLSLNFIIFRGLFVSELSETLPFSKILPKN